MRMAPSSRIVSPLSIGFSMMARASWAYSAGFPSRGGNGTILPSASCTSGGMPSSIGVSKMPGAIVITRMPSRDRSRAIASVIATTPPLDAA